MEGLTAEQQLQLVTVQVAVEEEYGYKPPDTPAHWLDRDENEKPLHALITASWAKKKIPGEVARLRELQKEAKNDREFETREYQIEYVTKHLTRAEEIATNRLAHFRSLETEADLKAEEEKCRDDINYWFEYYAWGYDPRKRSPLSTVPFALFPKQVEYVHWLDDLVFRQRTSGIVEKSRDEGATETSVRWGLYHWLLNPGFSMLLSTRKEDEVDSKQNQNTLFERIRFQIRLLPTWMHPEGFDIQRSMLGTMKLANPENGNTLLGEAPVENMGRGGRVTVAFLDEPAFWPFAGYPQYASLSQTTDSIIMCSSVAGRLNQFADLAFDGVTAKFVMDWRENPRKDKRWYDALPFGYVGPKMSATTIAQEIDRNYDASQPGKVWKYSEPHIFITMDEFMAYWKSISLDHHFYGIDADGRQTDAWQIPTDWRVNRTSDYGQTEGHEWGYMIGAQPHERYGRLADTHFIFLARYIEPTGSTEEQAVRQWREWERTLGLRDNKNQWINKPHASWCSHEAKDLRKVLLGTYGENWVAWDTDYQTGISTIQDWWTPIEVDDLNPFRPQLHGRCQLVFVSTNNDYQLAYNERLSQWFVTTSQTEDGFAMARKEIGAYHYSISELGKPVKAMRPVKEFDNIVDTIRGYAVNWNRNPEELTPQEKVAQIVGDAKIDWERARRENRPPSLEEQTRQDFALYQAQLEIAKRYGRNGNGDGYE